MLAISYDVSFSNISKNSSHHLRTSSLIGTGANTQFGDCDFFNMTLSKWAKDLTGLKFERLMAISPSHTHKRMVYWKCKCDCGNYTVVLSASLLNGNTQSCGCLFQERATERRFTHRLSKTPEYSTWQNMITRCTNPNSNSYKNYGLKGIVVCDRWRNSFENFHADMGNKPSKKHSLDRFPNKTGNYEPSNCRWATRRQQDRNKTNNVLLEYKGETKCLSDWAECLNIRYVTLAGRIKKSKWSIEKSFLEPIKKHKPYLKKHG